MQELKNIKNVVFDLGGVIIDLRRENAVSELTKLGIPDVDNLLGLYRQEGPFLDLEIGKLSPAEFFDTLRSMAKPGTSDLQIQQAFNAFLVGLPTERLEMLRALRRKGKRIYALSNTNAVMFNSWIAQAFRAEGLCIDDYFDGIVASFREGVCKPNPRIFQILLQRFSLNPSETILLDDSEANCKAAEAEGMKTYRIGLPGSGSDALAIAPLID